MYPGHQGSLHVSDFLDIVCRNCTRENPYVAYTRFGVQQGLPPGIATLAWGNPFVNANDEHLWPSTEPGKQVNISVPDMPERTLRKLWAFEGARVKSRIWRIGWRWVVNVLLRDKLIRPSVEINKLLGDEEFNRVRKAWHGCY